MTAALDQDQHRCSESTADALRRVVSAIEENPEHWDQTSYMSRSAGTFCLASWACLMAGMDVAALLAQGGNQAVSSAAQQLLGLTPVQAHRLFHYVPSARGLKRIVQLKNRIAAIVGVTFEVSGRTDEPGSR